MVTHTRIEDMRLQAKTYYDQAIEIVTKAEVSAEDLAQAEGLQKQAQELKNRATQLHQMTLERDQVVEHATPDAPLKPDFKKWVEFVGAVTTAHLTKGRVTDPRLRIFEDGRNVKDLSGVSGASGGFILPQASLTELMSVAAPLNVMRQGATVIPMGTRELTFPVLNQTGTVAGQPAYFGGVRVYWQEEATQMNTSDMGFLDGKLTARELVGYTRVGNSLLKDAPALAAYLSSQRGFPGAIAWMEDYAFLRGSGVGTPLGILNSPATKIVTRNTASQIKYDDLAKMVEGFMGQNPIWVATQSAISALLLINGPTGNPLYLWGNMTTGLPATLLGYPIQFVDKLPAYGTSGDIMLVDRSYYLIGTLEEGTTMEMSDQELFGKNQTSFRIIHRVDGQPWLSKVITLSDGTTTVSPFVVLS